MRPGHNRYYVTFISFLNIVIIFKIFINNSIQLTFIMYCKKALSPLVSFILIIAFTVATASLLYNLALDLIGEDSTCETVEIENVNICRGSNNNVVVLSIRNRGTNVDSLFVRINEDQFAQELEGSSLRHNSRFQENIQFRGNIRSLQVLPVVSGQVCDAKIDLRSLPRC